MAPIAESVGEKVLDIKDDLVDKAKDAVGNLGEKMNDLVEKAEAENAKFAAEEAANPTEFSKKVGYDDTKGSMLEGKDDFFSKAEAFADGRYGEVTNTPTITPIEDAQIDTDGPIEINKPGFEDLVGDGNAIVDDAIVED